MDIQAKQIPVDRLSMTAVIDASNHRVFYIVNDDGSVDAFPLPSFGALELLCQNYKVGNLAYRITLKNHNA